MRGLLVFIAMFIGFTVCGGVGDAVKADMQTSINEKTEKSIEEINGLKEKALKAIEETPTTGEGQAQGEGGNEA